MLEQLLSSCLAKIKASEAHLDRFNEATNRFFEGKSQIAPIAGEANPQRTKYVFTIEEVIDWPALEFGVIIGDCVHCLRSALDQLVWGLARVPDSRTAFPICRTEKEWITDAPSRYWSVPDTYISLINRAQPYHRGDKAAEHPLALLSVLSNLDKHRGIPTIALVPDNHQCEIGLTHGIAEISNVRFKKGAVYERGAVIAEAKIVPDDSGLEPQVHANFTQTFDVGFGDIPGAPWLRRKPVFDTFNELIGQPIVDLVFKPLYDGWNEAIGRLNEEAITEGGAPEG